MAFEWKPVQGDSERIYATKEDYFAWARKWFFAKPSAREPRDFFYAVRCNIQDQAAAGFMIDVDRSVGDNLVYRKLPTAVQVSDTDLDGLARKVLNLTE